MKEILFLEPVFKEMIWGGSRLGTDFHYQIPSENTGECWAVSAHENGDCVIKNGEYAGQKLSSLWKNHKELFGGQGGDKFPLLVKIIDAKDDLSIQVHPNDSYANTHENGSFGKTECWYVLDCHEGATIVVGHNAKDKEELKQMIEENRWSDLIRSFPIKKGDFFQITPGTVHAIKGGTMILETQQNSDITYRLYDYGRLQNGKPRELHLDKSIDVINCPYLDTKNERTRIKTEEGQVEELIQCEYYKVEKIDNIGTMSFTQTEPFTIFSVIDGEGTIDGVCIKKGDHFILTNGYGEYKITGLLSLISSKVN